MIGTWGRLFSVAFVISYATAFNIPPLYNPPICPPTGHHKYPNNNCAMYYACDNGTLQEMSCPFGQLFDRITLRCHFSLLVNCFFRPLLPIPTQEPNTSIPLPASPPDTAEEPVTIPIPTTITPTTQPIITTPPPPVICPPIGELIVSAGDCVSYYNCTNGIYRQQQCTSGFLFNPASRQCTPFFLANCVPQPTTPDPAILAPTTQSVCPSTGLALVPTGDCFTYYSCNNGAFTTGTCPAGTLFDPARTTCAPFTQVSCTPNSSSAIATYRPTTPPPVLCPPNGSASFPQGDCFSYYQCTNGLYTVQQCPSGSLFDPGQSQCVPFYQTSCTPQTG